MTLPYDRRAIDDLSVMLQTDDWVELGSADEQKDAVELDAADGQGTEQLWRLDA